MFKYKSIAQVQTNKTTKLHAGQLYTRGIHEGIILLRDALADDDRKLVRSLIEMAEKQYAEAKR